MRSCPGETFARNCAAGGGVNIFLSDHAKKVWSEVGFVSVTFELGENDN